MNIEITIIQTIIFEFENMHLFSMSHLKKRNEIKIFDILPYKNSTQNGRKENVPNWNDT